MRTGLVWLILTTLTLLWTFTCHRFLAFGPLGGSDLHGFREFFPAFLTGFMSDVLVATLFGLLVFLIGTALALALTATRVKFKIELAYFRVAMLVLITTSTLIVIHQTYVEFYGFQIIPFHLSYLGDPDFASANATAVLSPSAMILGFLSFVPIGLLIWFTRIKSSGFEQILNKAGTFKISIATLT